jgi:hypothetical protein
MDYIQNVAGGGVNIKTGYCIDENYPPDQVRLVVVATGFGTTELDRFITQEKNNIVQRIANSASAQYSSNSARIESSAALPPAVSSEKQVIPTVPQEEISSRFIAAKDDQNPEPRIIMVDQEDRYIETATSVILETESEDPWDKKERDELVDRQPQSRPSIGSILSKGQESYANPDTPKRSGSIKVTTVDGQQVLAPQDSTADSLALVNAANLQEPDFDLTNEERLKRIMGMSKNAGGGINPTKFENPPQLRNQSPASDRPKPADPSRLRLKPDGDVSMDNRFFKDKVD